MHVHNGILIKKKKKKPFATRMNLEIITVGRKSAKHIFVGWL